MGRQSELGREVDEIHAHAAWMLDRLRHRHTTTSRCIVDVLATADVALTMSELIEAGGRPTSSTYRSLQRLCAVSVTREVPHIGQARFELSAVGSSLPRCHLQCRRCGKNLAPAGSPAVSETISALAITLDASGTLTDSDAITVVGTCIECDPGHRSTS